MPELPEVETLRRSLEPHLLRRRIEGVRVHSPSLREPLRLRQLARRLVGKRVLGLRRRAKYLLVDVEGGATLVLHLGMSGRITLAPAAAPLEPHEHLSLVLSSGLRMRFRDPRRFGLVFAAPTARLAADRHLAALGAEPLDPAFDGGVLARAAGRRRAPVKTLLTDARALAGVGNIYASEALHRAGIHPRRSVARISGMAWQRLAAGVRAVLEDAIREGGTTLNDFADGEGRSGTFQVSLAVYGRDGEPCPRCGRTVRRIVQAGRSTYYCPGCQR